MPPPLAFLPVTSRALPKINGRVYAPASSVQALQKSYILQSYCFAWHNVRWGCYVKLALRAHTSRWSVTTPPHPPLITVLASLALSLNPPPWAGGPGGQVWFTVSGTRGHPRARAPSSSFQPLRVGTLVWQFSCVRRPGYSSLAPLVRQTGRKRPACTRFFSGGFITQWLLLVVEYQKNQKTAAKSEH